MKNDEEYEDSDSEDESSSDDEHLEDCIICDKEEAPYRCPNCILKYCSIPCYKAHKETNICKTYIYEEDEIPALCTPRLRYRDRYYPTQDTIPRKNLKRLCQGENLKKMKTFFENKKIRSYIKILDSCEDPEPEIKAMMQDPEFFEFASFSKDIIDLPDDPTKSVYENYRIKMRKELMDFFSGKTGKGSRK